MTNINLINAGQKYWDANFVLSEAAKQFHSLESMNSPYQDSPIDITFFVSCYNEEKFIRETLKTVIEAMRAVGRTYEIIIIDDGS